MKTGIRYCFSSDLGMFRKYAYCLFLISLVLTIISCQESTFELLGVDRTPVVSLSNDHTELRQSLADRDVVTFNWTASSNFGTNARINYIIQFDWENNDFEYPVEFEIGVNVYAYTIKGAELNNLVRVGFGAEPGQEFRLKARIKAEIRGEDMEPQISNEAILTVLPYLPVTSALYIIGDATPNGWNADSAKEMTRNNQNLAKFSTTVFLSVGNFKFITTQGEFLPSYNKGESDSKLVYRDNDEQPDEQFRIENPGLYKVDVDLENLTISYQMQEGPQFDQIFIVGDASESGWDINTPKAFTQSQSDPFVFTYMGMLQTGEFKLLAGSTGDWCGQWYMPLVNEENISSTSVAHMSGCGEDNKWRVQSSEAGFFKITLNIRDVTVKIEKISLYIIGDAGPNGWDIASPSPMHNEGAIYTYEGPLNPGELKISMFKGDWCGGQWINAATPDQPLSNTSFIFTQGCDGPDNKWRITNATAGNYKIQINLPTRTMTFE